MKRSDIIEKLSRELAIKLERQDQYELIKQYIMASMVSEIDRAYGVDLEIYQKIHPQSGVIIDEYFGVEEIYDEIKRLTNANKRTIKTSILKSVKGERQTAYNYIWKKI